MEAATLSTANVINLEHANVGFLGLGDGFRFCGFNVNAAELGTTGSGLGGTWRLGVFCGHFGSGLY